MLRLGRHACMVGVAHAVALRSGGTWSPVPGTPDHLIPRAERTEPMPSDEIVGYGPAAEYLGLKRNTLSSYVARGSGPRVKERRIRGQYVLPVFDRAELDRWKNSRPGQG